MYELKVVVSKILGQCTAQPPMKPGDYITVRDGDIRIPEGGYICLWALQSMLPVLALKERKSGEDPDEDWVWRVHHVQCPDPDGRVIYHIVRSDQEAEVPPFVPLAAAAPVTARSAGGMSDLRVVVEEVQGKCTSGMQPGDYFLLRSGRIYIPADRHFCLYALQAAIPLLTAKQRAHTEGDFLMRETRVLCPDPAGNVILHIER